jgi:hypothetical protein
MGELCTNKQFIRIRISFIINCVIYGIAVRYKKTEFYTDRITENKKVRQNGINVVRLIPWRERRIIDNNYV